jgi:methyl-accepting chemotaxis protein
VSIPSRTRTKIEKLYTALDQLEDDLILRELDSALDLIKKSASKIEIINNEIRETNKNLEAIAEVTDKAAKAVKALVQRTFDTRF